METLCAAAPVERATTQMANLRMDNAEPLPCGRGSAEAQGMPSRRCLRKRDGAQIERAAGIRENDGVRVVELIQLLYALQVRDGLVRNSRGLGVRGDGLITIEAVRFQFH